MKKIMPRKWKKDKIIKKIELSDLKSKLIFCNYSKKNCNHQHQTTFHTNDFGQKFQ